MQIHFVANVVLWFIYKFCDVWIASVLEPCRPNLHSGSIFTPISSDINLTRLITMLGAMAAFWLMSDCVEKQTP